MFPRALQLEGIDEAELPRILSKNSFFAASRPKKKVSMTAVEVIVPIKKDLVSFLIQGGDNIITNCISLSRKADFW